MKKKAIDYYEEAKHIGNIYYDNKVYEHVMRVSNLIENISCTWLINPSSEDLLLLKTIAIYHDILEDTDFEFHKNFFLEDENAELIYFAVNYLTKDKYSKYDDYCRNLTLGKYSGKAEQFAYIVKMADMKDHLMLKETLTDRLKEKYLNGLTELL